MARLILCAGFTLTWVVGALQFRVALASQPFAQAGDVHSDFRSQPEWTDPLSGPLCGVYSTCGALRMLGYDCDPTDYYSVDYAASPLGSTPEELVSIANDVGATATVISGMSAIELWTLPFPIVANVRSSPSARVHDHWVLIIYRTGQLLVYDGPRPPVEISLAEFLGMWSGLGVVVHSSGQSPLIPIWLARFSLMPLGIAVALALKVVLARLARLANGRLPCLYHSAMILAMSSLLSVGGIAIVGDVLSYPKGARLAIAPYVDGSFRIATPEELNMASQQQQCLIIDARLPRDYARGTVPGAVNIPVYASLWEIHEYLQSVSRATPLFVFCQSASCGFDETVAANIRSLGFANIAVCEKGWVAFEAQYSTMQ